MATFAQEKSERDALRTALAELAKLKLEDLAREGDLGSLGNFSSGIPVFQRLLQLYQDLAGCSLDESGYTSIQQLRQRADTAIALFKAIQEFQPEQGKARRDQLIAEVEAAYDSHYETLAPRIAYAISRGTDFRALEREARGLAAEMRRAADGAKTTAEAKLAEVETIVNTARATAARIGVAHHATNFEAQAGEHAAASRSWFRRVVGLSVLGILVLIALFVWPWHPETAGLETGQAIYAVVSRLLVFSVVSYALLWSSRHYTAHQHNYIINRHRQNALRTFETFVAAAGGEQEVKNAVLLHASQSIFSPQASGFVSKEPLPSMPQNLIEVVRRAGSTDSES